MSKTSPNQHPPPGILTSKPKRIKGRGIMKYMEANEYDVLAIENMSNDNWRRPIIECLENPTGISRIV